MRMPPLYSLYSEELQWRISLVPSSCQLLFSPGRISRDKGTFAEAPGCQARKGASKAIGEQVFFDGVDAVLDAGSMFHAIAASFLRFCAKQKSQRPRTPDLGAWPSCYCRNTRHIVYGFGLLCFLACELFSLGQALLAVDADNTDGAYGAYEGSDEQVGA